MGGVEELRQHEDRHRGWASRSAAAATSPSSVNVGGIRMSRMTASGCCAFDELVEPVGRSTPLRRRRRRGRGGSGASPSRSSSMSSTITTFMAATPRTRLSGPRSRDDPATGRVHPVVVGPSVAVARPCRRGWWSRLGRSAPWQRSATVDSGAAPLRLVEGSARPDDMRSSPPSPANTRGGPRPQCRRRHVPRRAGAGEQRRRPRRRDRARRSPPRSPRPTPAQLRQPPHRRPRGGKPLRDRGRASSAAWASLHADDEQSLLGAVVQVAFEPPSGVVRARAPPRQSHLELAQLIAGLGEHELGLERERDRRGHRAGDALDATGSVHDVATTRPLRTTAVAANRCRCQLSPSPTSMRRSRTARRIHAAIYPRPPAADSDRPIRAMRSRAATMRHDATA